MSAATLDSWVNGRKYPTNVGTRFFKPLINLAMPGRLSFYNLVEAHILLSTRKKHLVEMPAIRRALDYVRKTYPSPHPLMTENFLTDGKDLLKEQRDKEQEKRVTTLCKRRKGVGHPRALEAVQEAKLCWAAARKHG
jgi:hypothetical protein